MPNSKIKPNILLCILAAIVVSEETTIFFVMWTHPILVHTAHYILHIIIFMLIFLDIKVQFVPYSNMKHSDAQAKVCLGAVLTPSPLVGVLWTEVLRNVSFCPYALKEQFDFTQRTTAQYVRLLTKKKVIYFLVWLVLLILLVLVFLYRID